jgi:hypothetical protein
MRHASGQHVDGFEISGLLKLKFFFAPRAHNGVGGFQIKNGRRFFSPW